MLEKNVELLAQLPIFQGLTHHQLGMIADCGSKAFFQAGDAIVREGEQGEVAYMILTGKASCFIRNRNETFEEDLWPGTLIGELAMLVETIYPITVVAKERVRALAIHREAFREVMERDPAIAQHMSDMLLARLSGLVEQLRTVDEKLAAIEEAA